MIQHHNSRTLRSAVTAIAMAAAMLTAGCATQQPLAERWAQLRTEQPKVHPRDAAQKLGVSEAQLVATEVGRQSVRLKDGEKNFKAIFERLPELGRIKAITRNESAVAERAAVVTPAVRDEEGRVKPGTGFVGGPIDLRFISAEWASAFAVVQPGRGGKTSRSVQFFDRYGDAVHKVYLDNEEHVAAFDKLVADFTMADQRTGLKVDAAPAPGPVVANPTPSQDDIRELRQSWHELTDVHQFPRLLKELKLTREQALQLIGADSAWRIQPSGAQALLDEARSHKQPIMVFVSNRGMVQIYSGQIEKTSVSGDWLNVLDSDFNLHLRKDAVDHGWVVRRPTDHGIVTSVEFYDAKGNMIVNFFSRRDRGQEETAVWRSIVGGLPRG